ncbi:MAG: hypothetical protein JRF55_14450 [Deltaproteobacteria bacterium]|jgi:hypothetical protein|nr:hypothetical protein [Deltaproteobacteria bacterium]MBW2377160.1 hypothetical protein [Deltaproteobacteria bacterium]
MSDTYNNVPMSDAMAARTEKEDAFWTGPRLIVLSFVTLAVAFTLLWSMAEGIIGPTQHDATYGHEQHLLQPGGGPMD